jgi:2-(1,2-epoxy-1,2-dihydrophenyl)acetyl-CoA isomerase
MTTRGLTVGAESDGLDVVEDGPVLRLTLTRAKAGNAINHAVMAGLLAALDRASRSDEVRVVALTAQGRNFCTGIDLAEANDPAAQPSTRPRAGYIQRRINLGAHHLVQAFAELQLPVVVGVRGWTAGLGNTLALLSDYIVASETAKFWTPFVGRGFTPDSASSYLLPRLIGLPRAKEMLLLGRPVDAAKAERWGMVNELVADEDLEERVEVAVGEFARAATASVGLAKVLVHRNLDAGLSQALVAEAMMEEVSLRSADFKEGIASLRQKRDPDYTGL